MAKHVWGYWDCPTCGNKHIRGDKHFCTHCGAPIPDNVKYYMDPNAVEYVAEEEKKYGANWVCDYCSTQNLAEDLFCGNCGSSKGDASKNYFGKIEQPVVEKPDANWICDYCGQSNPPEAQFCSECGAKNPKEVQQEKQETPPPDLDVSKEEKEQQRRKLRSLRWDCGYCSEIGLYGNYKYCPRCGMAKHETDEFYEPTGEEHHSDRRWVCAKCHANVPDESDTEYCPYCGTPKPVDVRSVQKGKSVNKVKETEKKLKKLGIFALIAAVLLFIFVPVKRTAEITDFEWERTVGVEEFKNVDESGWSLPKGANLHEKKREIRSYKKVIDHYETKTRKVSHQEFDGYDTHYRDLGNGQFEEVQTPKYKTVYETETYEEPVYRDEPVYDTKYYYDIDKWVEIRKAATNGSDHEPRWADLSKVVTYKKGSEPKYGDIREGEKNGKYYIILTDKWGDKQTSEEDYDKWKKAKEGDKYTYKTFRFSHKPL